ncbi:ATP-dependent RNA helicase [Melia azedarach]|uniref:ATP-dependent RNA helicase n=1 Tax=Melia azedarach TaxID=155640 RepID=A0ACC1XJ94_MELAZ|nr:ATP-dependent RNA helicase [Melia azedarach]
MTAPNMATITESLERSLQNCSLNNHQRIRRSLNEGASEEEEEGIGRSDDNNLQNDDTALELNSHVSLPYHWEQCLDLKTGEVYYINWRNGMKAKEDPRTTAESSGDFYSEDDSSYDSEESSSESSPSSSREQQYHRVEKNKGNVLVVAGCKSCLMYFMVPKQVEDCPKCNGQLLHFDRSDNGSP